MDHSNLSQYCNGYWFVLHDKNLLLEKNNSALPNNAAIVPIAINFTRFFKLGTVNNVEYYCAELSSDACLPEHLIELPIRQAIPVLHAYQYGLCVKAFSVVSWDKTHQFCGQCGGNTTHQTMLFERICQRCQLSFFPRISPSIIVLIQKGDYLLMARSPHFAPGIYGLIAGFVEAGENLEEAVHREVKEEVDLQIKNLSYFGSQPWPFQDSLMVGFMAEYKSGSIIINTDEIEDAGWYRYDNLPGRPSVSTSIASILIDHFVNVRNKI